MTNHWIDIKNSDCVLIMGANPAENHPIAMRWVLKARDDNAATVVSVDPRFTRTSAVADIYAPLRCGTDIAFLGGLIRFIVENDLIHREYVENYTNALFKIDPAYDFDVGEGVFSGYDSNQRCYDNTTWQYATVETDETDALGRPILRAQKAATLDDPQCVFQLLKKHYARYTVEQVSAITGTPARELLAVYRAFAETSAVDKAGTILYAMGWTQHTVGTQNIRAMTIVQLLLGNVGRAGGGVNALRGESNVQGSTDHGLLFHTWPGYLKVPRADDQTLDAYTQRYTPRQIGPQSANGWSHYANYATSFLNAMFGDSATPENQFGFPWLPKLDEPGEGDHDNCSWLRLFDRMHEGQIEGLFAWGQNPACSGANASKTRNALTKLKWLVNVNIFPNETGWFFQDENLGIEAQDISTEVFVLPAAISLEKSGSITNSGRWVQWRDQAADPPGDAMADSQIMNLIWRELVGLYRQDGAFPEPIVNLRWDYFDREKHPSGPADAVARHINGRHLTGEKAGRQVFSFTHLAADGSTASGNWLYCGSYADRPVAESPKQERNKAKWRNRETPRRIEQTHDLGLNSDWAWCWPANRRILYNRASVDLTGQPFDKQRPVIAFQQGIDWQGDMPDGTAPPLCHRDGTRRDNATLPFLMTSEGYARLFAAGLKDGPLPEHYEPLESPLQKNPLNEVGTMLNPAVALFDAATDPIAEPGSRQFPYVCTTYRVTEHWQTGVMSRHCPWLMELQPQLFVELSKELAKEKGIRPGQTVWVRSIRGQVAAIALPTARLKPLRVQGRTVHQVGLPWCFGWKNPPQSSPGTIGPNRPSSDSANVLTASVGDANTLIPETKAFMVDIVASPP